MQFNKEWKSRASTWLTGAALVAGVVLQVMPNVPIGGDTKAWILVACTALISLSQKFTFKKKKVEHISMNTKNLMENRNV